MILPIAVEVVGAVCGTDCSMSSQACLFVAYVVCFPAFIICFKFANQTAYKCILSFVQIYLNTLLNWKAIDVTLGHQVKTIMYMTNSSVDNQLEKLARDHGWLVFEAPKVSSSRVPFLKQMYRHASQQIPNCTFYGFSNGDILYNENLLVTLDAVSKVSTECPLQQSQMSLPV